MMKQILGRVWTIANSVVLGMTLALTAFPIQSAFAVVVPNTASGDIAGNAGDLDQTGATISLDVSVLGLVKAAFLTDGTQLADGASVAKGTHVRFLIHVDNPTDGDVDSLNVLDSLPAAFAYLPGTIQVDSTIVTGATEAAMYAAVVAGAYLDDGLNGTDVAGYDGVGGDIKAGDSSGNDMIRIPRKRVWAMVFETVVQ